MISNYAFGISSTIIAFVAAFKRLWILSLIATIVLVGIYIKIESDFNKEIKRLSKLMIESENKINKGYKKVLK